MENDDLNQPYQINISKLNKGAVLACLYNASHSLCGPGSMTLEEAQAVIDGRNEHNAGRNLYFDYLNGRVMKVHLGRELLDTRFYDRDNGFGAAKQALSGLIGKEGEV